jgi:hypothetical protein
MQDYTIVYLGSHFNVRQHLKRTRLTLLTNVPRQAALIKQLTGYAHMHVEVIGLGVNASQCVRILPDKVKYSLDSVLKCVQAEYTVDQLTTLNTQTDSRQLLVTYVSDVVPWQREQLSLYHKQSLGFVRS